jgi:hypothetical protein
MSKEQLEVDSKSPQTQPEVVGSTTQPEGVFESTIQPEVVDSTTQQEIDNELQEIDNELQEIDNAFPIYRDYIDSKVLDDIAKQPRRGYWSNVRRQFLYFIKALLAR